MFYIRDVNKAKRKKQDMKKVNFYEGSYQFKTVSTELNITESFMELILAKQYEYRPTKESLWCTVVENGIETSRFSFQYGVFGMKNISFPRK